MFLAIFSLPDGFLGNRLYLPTETLGFWVVTMKSQVVSPGPAPKLY